MKTRLLFRIIILILSLLVFSIGRVGFAENEEQQDAKDLTRSCRFEKNAAEMNALYAHDQKLLTACALKEHDVLTVQTKTDVSIGTLFFRFGCFDSAIVISQYDSEGTLLKEEAYYADSICAVYRTEVACQSVKMKPLMDQISICELEIYGIGTLPKTVPQMEPAVVRTDFLIVSTHPDDEWLFLGAVYPIYGGQRGLTGTFAYVTTPSFGRLHEAINSLWKAKMTTMPFFLNFPDVDRAAPQEQKDQFQAEEITLSLVRLYRRIKPLVVITQDPVRGEYGHWQHIVSAKSALEAALLAPDPNYDPESAEMYGTWTVQKVYQHMAEENQILLDVSEPLSTYNGKTALQVAIEAYRQHVSQQKYSFFPSM
ncbi:MAG: hypothetical protein Q4A88_08650, partial [Clostridia bacterium]|nr:hypothetical protein [Clostridia bacterium]